MTAGTRALYFVTTISIAIAALAAPFPAGAQTAKDLKCRGCVGSRDLGNKAVSAKHIKPNAVDSTAIKDASILPADLAATAQPTGAVHAASYITAHSLTPSLSQIYSVEMTAPSNGYAVVIANWTFSTFQGGASASCYVETTPGSGTGVSAYMESDPNDTTSYDAAALTRMFPVGKGKTTFYLNCREMTHDVSVIEPQITAIFVPNKY